MASVYSYCSARVDCLPFLPANCKGQFITHADHSTQLSHMCPRKKNEIDTDIVIFYKILINIDWTFINGYRTITKVATLFHSVTF